MYLVHLYLQTVVWNSHSQHAEHDYDYSKRVFLGRGNLRGYGRVGVEGCTIA